MTGEKYHWKRVWDLPTRVFHWLLAMAVSIGWWLGDNISFETISWHFYLGYSVGGLVIFRLVWGLIGPGPARLRRLVHKPATTFAYLSEMPKREPSGFAGHSPAGSASVVALLGCLAVQVITGLFAESDALFSSGPLAGCVSSDAILLANTIHGINAQILLALSGLHLGAIIFYRVWKHENLVGAMITGRKLLLKDMDKN